MSITKSAAFDLLSSDPCCYKSLPLELRLDKDIAKFIVGNNISMIDILDDDLKKDKMFIVSLLIGGNTVNVVQLLESFDSLRYILDDEECVLELANRYWLSFNSFNPKFTNNVGFLSKLVTKNSRFLSFIDESWLDDQEFVEKVVTHDKSLIPFFIHKEKMGHNMILRVLEKDGTALQYLDRNHKANPEYVLTALSSNYRAAIYTHEILFKMVVLILLVKILNILEKT